jgi:hypothetical protein
MKIKKIIPILLLALTLGCVYPQTERTLQRSVLFSHQSVGRNMICSVDALSENLRADQNIRNRTTNPLDPEVEFWDHDYSFKTATNNEGNSFPSYGWKCGQNTDHDAWCVGMKHLIGDPFQDNPPNGYNGTTSEQATMWRNFCSSFDIVIIKPGYRDIHLIDEAELEEYKTFLNNASDWWHNNNPGQYFCIMTASPLRPPTGVGAPNAYSNELWLLKKWALRHPENKVFLLHRKTTCRLGGNYVRYFTNPIYTNDPNSGYDSGDHHLNKLASNTIQNDFVNFINDLVKEMNTLKTHNTNLNEDY